MNDELLTLLRGVDTPTVCNAIEVAQGKRGFGNFSRKTMLSSAPEEPPIVGYARTARIAGLKPPTADPQILRDRRMAYYRYMSEGPRPAVAVIEDVDYPDCIAAYWGEINTTIHLGFGMAGAVTNGVMRDLGEVPKEFPVLAGFIGPSHGFVHIVDYNQPIEIFGLSVSPDDLVHADRHGALVIPADIIPVLPEAVATLLRNEQIVLGPAREDGFNWEKFQEAWAAFERSRT